MKNNRAKSIIGIIAMSIVMMCLAGCPAGDKWQQAANASDNLIKSVDAAQDLEITLYHSQTHTISVDEHLRIQEGFKRIAQLDKVLNAAIRGGSQSGSAAAFDSALSGVDEAISEGVFNVKDPTANLAIKGAVDASRFLLLDIRTIATSK